jgi:predicted enzyme related to lactoylglutathione lyase
MIERSRWKEPQIGDFSWHELMTTNPQTAFDFYAKLFGWEKMQAMDMGPQGTYQIFGTGGHQLGGIFNPGTVPGGPQWLPYIMVRDARKTAELATSLGATIAQGPMEVPGGDMVFSGIDREGAMFAAHAKKRVPPPPKPVKAVRSASTKSARPAKPVRKASPKKPARPTKKKTAKKPARRR